MEILHNKNHKELLDYLPHIKSSIQEWLFVDIRLTAAADKNFHIATAAQLVHALYKEKEGKLYVGNDHEILMLLRCGQNRVPSEVSTTIERHLPKDSCSVHVEESTLSGLTKLAIFITPKRADSNPPFSDIRRARTDNVILAADDDMYMRILVKKGLSAYASVHEASDGKEIVDAYKKHIPDILFLDIHMPNIEGTEVLRNVLAVDPEAYIIMLSADSSRENVAWTIQQGAKGFLTKPFTKDKLIECAKKCPTIVWPPSG